MIFRPLMRKPIQWQAYDGRPLGLILVLAPHDLGSMQNIRNTSICKGPLIGKETEEPYLSYLSVSISRIYFQAVRIYRI